MTSVSTPAPFVPWERLMHRWYGLRFPDDYLAFDFETTGTSRKKDLLLEAGWVIVRERKIVNRGSFLLDWTKYPGIELDWLEGKIRYLRRCYEEKNKPYNFSIDRIRSDGRDPVWVLKFLYDLFLANREAGAKFAGQNAIAFDAYMFSHQTAEFLDNSEWVWQQDEILDTGCWEKILQSQYDMEPGWWIRPKQGEPLHAFMHRARYCNRPGLYWNIEAAVDRYQLCEKYGVCKENLHGAAEDSYAVHLLIEHHRDQGINDGRTVDPALQGRSSGY